MLKPFQKWLSNTGLSLLILFFVGSSSAAEDPAEDALNRARALANKTDQRFGSTDKLNQSVVNPMISGSVPLSTVDGSLSSHVAIGCAASDKFLEVSVNPGPTGDLSLQAALDRRMNGEKSFYSAPFPVSGICANGVITCDPGTWNYCRGFIWRSSLERIFLEEVPSNLLGGCYCVNNSCGANLYRQNSSGVLKDIGGGIVGAVQQENRGLAIADTKVVGDSLVYFGQNTEQCRSGEKASSLSSLYEDSNKLNQPVENLSSSTDSKRYAELVTSTVKDSGHTEKKCFIQQDYGIETATQLCEQPVPQNTIGSKEETTFMAVKTASGRTERNDCQFEQDSLLPPDTAVVSVVPAGAVSLGDRYVLTHCQKRRGKDTATFDVYSYYSRCQRTNDIKTETQFNNCGAITAATGCSLKDETIDGVQVIRAHYRTGKHVVPTCRTFTGLVTNFTECSAKWRTDRVYSCEAEKKSFNFSEARIESLIGSVSGEGGNLTYQSQQGGVSEKRVVILPKQKPAPSCVPACKTKKRVSQTDVVDGAGHAGVYRVDAHREETHYKTCSPTCPIEAGETLVKDCQCLNEFAEAVAMMSVLNAAGKDLICSSGTKSE